jgi:hypothetical protein
MKMGCTNTKCNDKVLTRDDDDFYHLCQNVVAHPADYISPELDHSSIVANIRTTMRLIDSGRISPLVSFERRDLEDMKRSIRFNLS